MYSSEERHLLKKIARDSISHGIRHGTPLKITSTSLPDSIIKSGACFVTLYLHGSLRGCIGSLQAHRPLAVDVAENAFAAAFRDYRFTPVEDTEYSDLDIHLSILSSSTAIQCQTEDELLNQLRTGIDGLIIEAEGHKATFLPSVWDSLPQAKDFVGHLKIKAGLPVDYWSSEIHCYRYITESF